MSTLCHHGHRPSMKQLRMTTLHLFCGGNMATKLEEANNLGSRIKLREVEARAGGQRDRG